MPPAIKYRYRILYGLVLLFTIPVFLFAADSTVHPYTSFRHYGPDDGLQCKTVYSMLQDKNGFMWFGTDQGVFQFDGKIFKHFTRQDGISDNEVFNLFQDSKGRIWFLTYNGYLSYWKQGKIYNRFNTPMLRQAHAPSIILNANEDKEGTLWFGTQQSGFIIIKGDSAFRMQFPGANLVLQTFDIAEDENGELWSFKNNKLFKLNEPDFKDSIPLPYLKKDLRTWHDVNHSFMLYFVDEGLCKMKNLKTELYLKKDLLPPFNQCTSLAADGTMLWICTSGSGCLEYKDGELNENYFPKFSINRFYKDREGNKWFGTVTDGVYMIPSWNISILNYNKDAGLSGDKVTSVNVDSTKVWIGYENGVVDELNHGSLTVHHLRKPNEQGFTRVQNIVIDSTVLCGTDAGIFSISGKNISFIPYSRNRNEDSVYAVKRMIKLNSDSIYFTSSFNFFRLMNDAAGFYLHEEFDSIVRTFSMTPSGNHLIISCSTGLMDYLPGKSLSPYETDTDLADTRFVDMKTDADGFLLMASAGNGLYIFRDHKLLQHFTTADGLADANCNRLAMDGNRCYLATAGGLNVLQKSGYSYQIINSITTKSGLLSNAINDIAIDREKILLGTEKGLSIVHQGSGKDARYFAPVVITDIGTDSLSSFLPLDYKFSTRSARILVRFSYPVFSPANNFDVEYRLLSSEEENGTWLSSINNQLEFTSLPPGTYTLELKPSIEHFPADKITRLNFEIVPLWWQRPVSKFLMLLLAFGLLFLGVRKFLSARYEKKIREQLMIENERNRIAADMHDDIGSDLTQISIWSTILKSTPAPDANVAIKLARSSEEVLEKMDQIIWALNPVHDQSSHLISYLNEYASQYLETAGIAYHFTKQEKIPDIEMSARVRRNVFLIMKEMLHNSVKHSKAKNVSLAVSYESTQLTINYADDGIGFNHQLIEKGLGFITMMNRAKEINASFVIDSKEENGTTSSLNIKL